MSIKIHILDASGRLQSQRDNFRRISRGAVRKVQRIFSLDNIDIVIRESEQPEIYKDIEGVGGWCPTEHFIQLVIDRDHPALKKYPKRIINNVLLHELHHAARMRSGLMFNRHSLLEFMFSEGLADYFVYEMTGHISKWVISTDKDTTERLLRTVQNVGNTRFTNKEHQEWFVLGSKEKEIPRFAGYAVGFEMVRQYLGHNPEKSAASLVATSVNEINLFL